LSAKEALEHPYFQEREPIPTANAFASLPNGNTIYPARKLIKDESDPKMMPVTNSVTQIAEGGGTSNIIPGASTGGLGANGMSASGSIMAGQSGQGSVKASGKNSLNNSFLSAIGPSAPPPAPASGGSVGPPSNMNSVGPSNFTSSNQQTSQATTQSQPPSNSRGGLVGAATANAGRAAKRQKKA